MAAKKYYWEPAEDELLMRGYSHHKKAIDKLQTLLPHYPRWQITRRAAILGLAKTKEPMWTPKEELLLEKMMSVFSLSTVARRLGRTITAVALKAKRIGCRKTSRGYTANGVAWGLGCDAHKVLRWIAQGKLRARHRMTERTARQGGDCWYIDPVDLRDFIKRNPDEVSFRTAAKRFLIDVLTAEVSPIEFPEQSEDLRDAI